MSGTHGKALLPLQAKAPLPGKQTKKREDSSSKHQLPSSVTAQCNAREVPRLVTSSDVTLVFGLSILQSIHSYPLDVIARKGAEEACAQRAAKVPAIIALLHHQHCVTLSQLQFVLVLRPVAVQHTV